MGISVAANLGAGALGVKYGNIGKRIQDGASIKDIRNEAKDKFVNKAKTAGKVAVITTGVGTVGVLGGIEAATGAISDKLPQCVKGLLEKAGNSSFVKSMASGFSEGFSQIASCAKSNPILFTGLAIAGAVGNVLILKTLTSGAKNEGKIEQKYDDILALKNSSAQTLD